MSDPGAPENTSFFGKVHAADQASQAEIQFRALVGEFGKEVVRAEEDLEQANMRILDIQENPLNFEAQQSLTEWINDDVLSCDIKRLANGMDAYSYGAGLTEGLEEDEIKEANYYREHVVDPILRRYRIKEGDLNKVHKAKSDAFINSFIGDRDKEET